MQQVDLSIDQMRILMQVFDELVTPCLIGTTPTDKALRVYLYLILFIDYIDSYVKARLPNNYCSPEDLVTMTHFLFKQFALEPCMK